MSVVTQCQPEDTHGEFKPSNRNELLPQSPPFHAKGRRSTDPITNARAKVRTAPGMVLDTVKPTFQSIVQTPPLFTQSRMLLHRTDQGKPNSLTFSPRITIYTNKYMDIDVYSFPHRLDVMILNANYLEQRG